MVREPSHSETASSQQIVMRESPHRDSADGDGAIPRRDSERLARQPSHGETASGQWIVRRESPHGDAASKQRMAMEPSHGEAVSG